MVLSGEGSAGEEEEAQWDAYRSAPQHVSTKHRGPGSVTRCDSKCALLRTAAGTRPHRQAAAREPAAAVMCTGEEGARRKAGGSRGRGSVWSSAAAVEAEMFSQGRLKLDRSEH